MRYITFVAIGSPPLLRPVRCGRGPDRRFRLSSNLIINPGGESGSATPDSAAERSRARLAGHRRLLHGRATTASVGHPTRKDAPARPAPKFFVGCFAPAGQTINSGTATQDVSLAKWATDIDKQVVRISFSAELGGYNGTENRATAQIASSTRTRRRSAAECASSVRPISSARA